MNTENEDAGERLTLDVMNKDRNERNPRNLIGQLPSACRLALLLP